jgi:hypothetical protein
MFYMYVVMNIFVILNSTLCFPAARISLNLIGPRRSRRRSHPGESGVRLDRGENDLMTIQPSSSSRIDLSCKFSGFPNQGAVYFITS